MIGKKINQLATELAPTTTDLTIIGDPVTGVSKKITLEQLGAIFGGAVSFYTTLGDFPATGVIDNIYCAKDTKKLYLWSGSAYVEVFPSQSLLDTYQLRSEKGVSNGYASLDVNGKVPIGQLPNSIMEYKGTWNAATNTPTLANGTGDTGDVYICNAAGTVNFGAGPITFAVGDYVVYSGTIWQRSSGAVGTVTSVAVSRSGDALAITGSPITTSGTINLGFAGTGAQYIKGDGTLATFPSIISQAQNLVTEVYNNTGATLTKGTIVYINGGQGNLPTVTKALATGDSTSAQTYGVVQTNITNMNNGYVVVAGRLTDLDTQAYSNGTQLYLSSTTAGTWTSTKQYAPNHLVYVGIVVRSHPTQGVVEVKIQNGYEMDELHNVAAQSPDNNDILQYKTATSLWTKVAGTTTNIAEGTNLYYTDARSRAALSFTAGSGAYNSTTGVITIPTNTNQLTNGAAFITLASLSAGAGISYNNTTGVIASTITQYTDALARAAISLTTTGTSGAATYNNTTGVLNIPQYQTALTNPVTGTGTNNYLAKFTTTGSTIGNSLVFDNGTNVGVNTATPNDYIDGESGMAILRATNGRAVLSLVGTRTDAGETLGRISFTNTNSTNAGAKRLAYISGTRGTTNNSAYLEFAVANDTLGAVAMTLSQTGNLGIGVTPSAWSTSFGIKVIDLGSKGSVYASDNDANLSFNQFFDGTNAVYKTTGTASRFALIGNEFQWRQAPSGTAGNAISFTQAMTLNASGNLSIGNTNDTFKLDVTGTGRFTGQLNGSTGVNVGSNALGTDRMFQVSGTAFTSGGNQFGAVINPTMGTLTTVWGLYLGINCTSATTGFGIYIAGSGGTVTNRWGLYQDGGSDRNYFAGNVGIGITNPLGYAKLSLGTGTGAKFLVYDNGTNIFAGLGQDLAAGNSTDLFAHGAGGGFLTFGSLGTNGLTYTEWARITNAGNLQINGGSIQTGAPTNGTAQPWRLGDARSGAISTNSYIIVSVNGTTYSIPALNGLP